MGVGTGWSLRPLPPQAIVRLHDSILHARTRNKKCCSLWSATTTNRARALKSATELGTAAVLHKRTWGASGLLSIQRTDMKTQRLCGAHKVTNKRSRMGIPPLKLPLISAFYENANDHDIAMRMFSGVLRWLRPCLDSSSSAIPHQPVLGPGWITLCFLLEGHNQGWFPPNKTRTQTNSKHISVISLIGKKVKEIVQKYLSANRPQWKKKKKEIAHICFMLPKSTWENVISSVTMLCC